MKNRGNNLHILIDLQGYQFEHRMHERRECLFLFCCDIIKKAKNHRISILVNGMDSIDNINAIKKSFKDILPSQELFIFSAQAPTAYCQVINHERYEAARISRNLAISNIDPDFVLLLSQPEHGYYDNAIVDFVTDLQSWNILCISHDSFAPIIEFGNTPEFIEFYKRQLTSYTKLKSLFSKKDALLTAITPDGQTTKGLFEQYAADEAIATLETMVEKQSSLAQRDVDEYFTNAVHQIQMLQLLEDDDKLGIAWALARNSFKGQQRKLLIDISVLVHHDARTGIQRVSRSILAELLASGVPGYEISPVYYVVGECYRYANKFIKQNFGLNRGKDEPVLFSKDDILLVTDLIIHSFPAMNEQLVNLRRAGAHAYFVVYDVLPLLYPQWCREDMQQLFPQWLSSIAEYTDGLICISASVADDVRSWLAQNSSVKVNPGLEITHFHLGADLEASMPTQGMPANSHILINKLESAPSFLMVGTLEPRKGHAQVLAAFEQLWRQGKNYRLFIVGKQGWRVEELCNIIKNHPQLGENLFWLSGISDEFLEKLYQGASALIFASFGEGFGLPLIEAAQKKLPLIIRDIPVFREIAQEHAFYFHGEAPENIVFAILQWFTLFEQGKHPKSEGMDWLNWRQSADMLLQRLPLVTEEAL